MYNGCKVFAITSENISFTMISCKRDSIDVVEYYIWMLI